MKVGRWKHVPAQDTMLQSSSSLLWPEHGTTELSQARVRVREPPLQEDEHWLQPFHIRHREPSAGMAVCERRGKQCMLNDVLTININCMYRILFHEQSYMNK